VDADKRVTSAEEHNALEAVLRAVRRIKHGSVQVIVQDGRVVQIDTTEKVRIERPP
jgi:hypothetical protein